MRGAGAGGGDERCGGGEYEPPLRELPPLEPELLLPLDEPLERPDDELLPLEPELRRLLPLSALRPLPPSPG